MSNHIPCGLEDDRCYFEPDQPEEVSLLTDAEKRLEWICDSWAEAQSIDTADEWHGVRCELYGASQALNHYPGPQARLDRDALLFLATMAFESSITCISEGKYDE